MTETLVLEKNGAPELQTNKEKDDSVAFTATRGVGHVQQQHLAIYTYKQPLTDSTLDIMGDNICTFGVDSTGRNENKRWYSERNESVFRKLELKLGAETHFDIWADLFLSFSSRYSSWRTNSRLRKDSTHCEHHIKKAIIFERDTFCSNNLGCFLQLAACAIPVFLCGTMFYFN